MPENYIDPSREMYQECHDQYSDLSFRNQHKLHSNYVPAHALNNATMAAHTSGIVGPMSAMFNRFGQYDFIDPDFEDETLANALTP